MKESRILEQHLQDYPVPAIPGVARRIVELVDGSSTRIAQISDALKTEPFLTKSILKQANSIEFGMRTRVSNLDYAIIILGFEKLKQTVAGALIQDALRKIVDVMFKYEEFWNHSISCGVVAHHIAHEYGKADPKEAFVTGLLHDVGHLVMRLAGDTQPEEHHPIVGAETVKNWSLPENIIDAIRWHHHPDQSTMDHDLPLIIYLADAYCQSKTEYTFSREMDSPTTNLDQHTVDAYGTTLNMDEIAAHFSFLNEDIAQIVNIKEAVKSVKESIVQAVSDLPREQKIIIALYYYEGLSFYEIGRLCNMDTEMVRAEHQAALMNVKDKFVQMS
jgi:putative nucleotidyltransferase with HDIG domain